MLSALTTEERRDLILSVGVHKKERRRSPIAVAELIAKASSVQSISDIAKEVHLKDVSMLRKFLALLRLPDEIQALVHWSGTRNFISPSTAYELTRLETDTDIEIVSRAVFENSFTKEEVQAIVQRIKRGKVAADDAISEILKLRPEVERQYFFVGRTPEDLLKNNDTDTLRRKLRLVLAKTIGSKNLLSVSCKGNRFSFMLSKDGVKSMKDAGYQLSTGNFEPILKDLLKDAL
jgi:hypothetical protein